MVPPILGCWICRHWYNLGRRMTPGYYLANLKTVLLPSLGPGVITGFVFKYSLRNWGYSEEGPVCLLMPASWILGCLSWWLIDGLGRLLFCLLVSQGLLKQPSPEEQEQWLNWGYHQRWYVSQTRSNG